MNREENIVELIDSEGESIFFEHLMTFTHKEQDYVVLATLEDDENANDEELEIVLLRVEVDDEENEIYVGISDLDELDEVFGVYEEILSSFDSE